MTYERTLEKITGYTSFKTLQRTVVDHIVIANGTGSDMICNFPTGYGKSICYCIPALHVKRTAIVISPLCSLIQDQTTKLNSIVPGVALNMSTTAVDDTKDVLSVYGHHSGQLVFCTPEKMAMDDFRTRLCARHRQSPLMYFVLDEAHLVTEQGWSFREDYLKLAWIRDAFPSVPIYCFSATCNYRVINHLTKLLCLKEPRLFQVSARKDNLHLSVHYARKGAQKCSCTAHACSWHASPSLEGVNVERACNYFEKGEVLVFASSRDAVQRIYVKLERALHGRVVAFYHAGLEAGERVTIQERFVRGEIHVLVATMASFGTGVDMPLVKKVVICGVPSSIFTLVQLVGRGGRTGDPYYVDIFVSPADMAKQRALVQNEIRNNRTKTEYIQYLSDGFNMLDFFVHSSRTHSYCATNVLEKSVTEKNLALRVPYNELSEFKIANQEAHAQHRARWDPVKRIWYLPPFAHNIHVEKWKTKAATSESVLIEQASMCMRCSSCKANMCIAGTNTGAKRQKIEQ